MRGSLASLLLMAGAAGAQSEAPPPEAPAGHEARQKPILELGGALRFSYFLKSWEGQEHNRKRGGEVAFDTLRLIARGQYGRLSLAAEYRVYAGFSFLRYGYLGYAPSETVELQAGLVQAPFGLLPLASNNWFNALAFYAGLEDDHDLGLKVRFQSGALELQLALFKGDEGSFSGRSLDSARYSFDLVRTKEGELGGAARADREMGQLNGRLAYRFQHSPGASTEVGLSARVGGISNAETETPGYHWAAAAHVSGTYGALGVQLEALAYGYHLAGPAGQDARFVAMGAFDAPYAVASRATLLVANVSYRWPVSWGPVDSLTLYNDYGLMLKPERGFSTSLQNVTGLLATAGPVYTFFELAAGRNHPFLGADFATALAAGRADGRWGFRPNVNLGYYF